MIQLSDTISPSIRTLALVAFAISAGACSDRSADIAESSDKPLNVLFILSDDQAPDTIQAHGNPDISTPSMDTLAEGGMSFTYVFNQGSWSGAVCAPSRRMINTGRHLYHTGMDPRRDEQQDYPVMGESFRAAGYDTFQTGKWHLPMDVWERSFTHGTAVFKGGMSRHEKGGQFDATFSNYDPSGSAEDRFSDYKAGKHTSEEIANAAVGFLDSREESDKPFMMYVAFLAPHDPRLSPEENLAQYPPDEMELPNNFLKFHPFDQGDYYLRDEVLAGFPRSEKVVRENISDYYAMITHMDTQIGRILDALEASGQADNTLIIYTSDHGLAIGSHGLMGKQNQYDHSVRAPFIVKGPGVPAGASAPGMFYLNSVFPTAAEMAGVMVPDTVEAPSIVPLIRGEKETAYDSVYGSYRHFQRMVRTLDHKLIYYPIIERTQLFDLNADPGEMHDLSEDPAQAERIAELMQELEDWKRTVGDPLTNDDPRRSYGAFLGLTWD
jgi:arylsulfatase A-like enzyme